MTREEAKIFIEGIRDGLHETGKDYPYRDDMIPLMKESCDVAIKALEQEPCKEQEIYEKAYKEGYDKGWSDGNFIGANRWIPVSERLPNIGETVLCQCQVNIYEVLKLTVDGWYHDNEHCYMEGFVIAWQPLPKWEE